MWQLPSKGLEIKNHEYIYQFFKFSLLISNKKDLSYSLWILKSNRKQIGRNLQLDDVVEFVETIDSANRKQEYERKYMENESFCELQTKAQLKKHLIFFEYFNFG